ncbi:SCO2400 family protein [Streptomyces sp. NRRL S-455]|uniref:SCO2400 family protein n=1 Tax=Streptomyces sp. NRRL S-455 TaxID=1463908 RepID=UPI003B631B11
MDYCDPCRRHLNGALACPGCGTSAESLRWREPEYGGYDAAPSGGEGEVPRRSDVAEEPEEPEEPEGPDGPGGEYDGDGDDGDDEPSGRGARRRGRRRGPAVDAPGGASRRDRKAAAHRRRRRRTLLVAAGFVLAAGGLSLAELGMDAPRSTPKPAAEGEPVDGDASPETDPPEGGGASKSVSPPVSDSPSASASPKPEKSKDAKGANDDDLGTARWGRRPIDCPLTRQPAAGGHPPTRPLPCVGGCRCGQSCRWGRHGWAQRHPATPGCATPRPQHQPRVPGKARCSGPQHPPQRIAQGDPLSLGQPG